MKSKNRSFLKNVKNVLVLRCHVSIYEWMICVNIIKCFHLLNWVPTIVAKVCGTSSAQRSCGSQRSGLETSHGSTKTTVRFHWRYEPGETPSQTFRRTPNKFLTTASNRNAVRNTCYVLIQYTAFSAAKPCSCYSSIRCWDPRPSKRQPRPREFYSC